jgi:electron transfer flavoprotein alpha subunit
MGNVLIVAEHHDGKLRKVTLPTLGFGLAAKKLIDGDLIALVLGHNVGDVTAELAIYGVDKVVVDDNPTFENYLAETYAPAIAKAVEELDIEIVATAASTRGRDFMPRAAALLEAAQISDAVAIIEGSEGITYKRPVWAGNLLQLVVSDSDVTCVTVRTTAFDAPDPSGSAKIETIDTRASAPDNVEFVNFDEVVSARPDLTDAKVIVAGGRGLKSKEGFVILENLADLMGGAVGATRAAVDSEMAPNDLQIGQTGKIVAPDLYFAVAISGAIQHLAGMKGSKVIVAINKNPEEPIFQVADYGLVADAFKVVPELHEKLKAILG